MKTQIKSQQKYAVVHIWSIKAYFAVWYTSLLSTYVGHFCPAFLLLNFFVIKRVLINI